MAGRESGGDRGGPWSLGRRSLGICLAAVGLGGIAWGGMVSGRGSVEPPLVAVIVDDPQTVTALGRLEPAGEIVAIAGPPAREGNRLRSLAVAQGDRVVAGQVLATLDSRDRLWAELQEAQARSAAAQAHLALVKAGPKAGERNAQRATLGQLAAERRGDLEVLETTRDRLRAEAAADLAARSADIERLTAEQIYAQAEEQRHRELWQAGALAASAYDSKRLALETARQRLDAAQADRDRLAASYRTGLQEVEAELQRSRQSRDRQLERAAADLDRIETIRPEEVQMAVAEAQAAQAAVTRAQVELALAEVKAPTAGQVLAVHVQPGELIPSGGAILDLGNTATMEAIAEVYDSDIRHVNIGQAVRLTGDAFDGALTGRVTRIGPQVLAQSLVDTDPAALVDGRVVEVRIRLDRASGDRVAHLSNSQVVVAIQTDRGQRP